MKVNQRKGLDGSFVVFLDGIDSSSVYSVDLVIVNSIISSLELYILIILNLNRVLFIGMIQ